MMEARNRLLFFSIKIILFSLAFATSFSNSVSSQEYHVDSLDDTRTAFLSYSSSASGGIVWLNSYLFTMISCPLQQSVQFGTSFLHKNYYLNGFKSGFKNYFQAQQRQRVYIIIRRFYVVSSSGTAVRKARMVNNGLIACCFSTLYRAAH